MIESRNTIQRQLVLAAVQQMGNHPTPEQVYLFVSNTHPSISRSTVYRNLNLLCNTGNLLKIPVPDAADHVDHNISPHCHAVCSKCGRVFDIDIPNLENPTGKISETHGFCIEGFHIIFFGKCAECKQLSVI